MQVTMMKDRQIVEPTIIRDQVADIVRQMILNGDLKGDDAISERYISGLLNVSTTPVKEAFRILEAENFIYTKPRKGTYVSRQSKDFMQQLAFMRGSMEGVAVYYATLKILPEEIEILETLIGEIEEKTLLLVNQEEASKELTCDISQLNAQFHSTLRSACRNEYLIGMIKSMDSIDRTIRKLSQNADNEEPIRALKDHKGLLESVKGGDPAVSEQRMIEHIRRVVKVVL